MYKYKKYSKYFSTIAQGATYVEIDNVPDDFTELISISCTTNQPPWLMSNATVYSKIFVGFYNFNTFEDNLKNIECYIYLIYK